MAQYLVLIYEDEAGCAGRRPGGRGRSWRAHNEFGEKHARRARRRQRAAADRAPRRRSADGGASPTGRSPRPRRRSAATTSIEAADLDEAIAIAKDVPAPFGGVEVRPVMVFD